MEAIKALVATTRDMALGMWATAAHGSSYRCALLALLMAMACRRDDDMRGMSVIHLP